MMDSNHSFLYRLSRLFNIMFLSGLILLLHSLCLGAIQISNIYELQNIGNDPSYPLDEEYELIQDIDASETINWNDGAGFVPIGTFPYGFSGKFNGNGCEIRNLYINCHEGCAGLFAVSSGEICNLILENTWVFGDNSAGGLIGYNFGKVTQCYFSGSVVGFIYVGGLIGKNDCTFYGEVKQCYSTGIVAGVSYVGGLVGNNYGVMVIQSYSTSNVSGSAKVGGLIGENFGVVKECYSAGNAFANNDVGGLIGGDKISLAQKSYWDIVTSRQKISSGGEGKTTVEMKKQATYIDWDFKNVWNIEENASYPFLRALGPTKSPPPVVIKDISSLKELNKIGRDWDYPWNGIYHLCADIDATETENWDGGKGFKPIGPFFGKFYGHGHIIRNLYINRLCQKRSYAGLFGIILYDGTVRELGLESAWVKGDNSVGTVAGWNCGIVAQCYSTGVVSGYKEVGGLVGHNIGTVTQSYSACNVSMLCRKGEIVMDFGGVVGFNHFIVQQCFSKGRFLNRSLFGGVIGRNIGTVTQSYWDIETSGQSHIGGGEMGKTTMEMKQQATYKGWDFDKVWGIVEGVSYPYLRWQGGPLSEMISIPNVVGKNYNEAEYRLVGIGLILEMLIQQCSDTVPEGNVVNQTPTAGQQVLPGTPITLVISTGPCPEGEGMAEGSNH
ncbi:MAG TPA: PASTA domain-containing protein [Candidatus Hydrogenedens sp.]|nr:PASTA domain-containing protein [Candidatus Hydrogenedens sp.]